MANEPQHWYRDQSKLDYLPAFNDKNVVRIDSTAFAAAAAARVLSNLYSTLHLLRQLSDVD